MKDDHDHRFNDSDQINPVMIRINTDAGHGAGKPTDMIIREYSDVWAFIYKNIDFEPEF